jgi:hypothetical protein
MTREDVIRIWRRECEKAGSQKVWAETHGLSPAYVSDVLGGNRGAKMISGAVLKALGLEVVVSYRKSRG